MRQYAPPPPTPRDHLENTVGITAYEAARDAGIQHKEADELAEAAMRRAESNGVAYADTTWTNAQEVRLKRKAREGNV